MSGANEILLPEKYAKYFGDFHNSLIQFGSVYEHINGKMQTTVYIILGFIMIITLKNSMQLLNSFKPTRLNLVFSITIFLTGISMMSRVSEFLYFNF